MVDNQDRYPKVRVGFPEEITGEGIPKKPSSSRIYLCSVGWSWSPAHSRSDDYSLHSGKTHWLLYVSFQNEFTNRIDHHVVATVSKKALDGNAAARLMLREFWNYEEFQNEIGRFEDVTPAWLGEKVIEEIADEVWGKEG